MPPLREISVNMIPRLDVRKADEMERKLANIMGKATNVFKNGEAFLNKASLAIDQGSDLLGKLLNILNKSPALQESVHTGNLIDDTAESLNSSSDKVMQVLSDFSQNGSDETAILDLMRKFAAQAPELGIKGDLSDAFVGYLQNMAKTQGIEQQKLIMEVLGEDTLKDINKAMAAKDLDARRAAIPWNQEMKEAMLYAREILEKTQDSQLSAQIDRLRTAYQNGSLDSQLPLFQMQENAKTQPLENMDKNDDMSVQTHIMKISSSLEALVQSTADLGMKWTDAMGIFEKINHAMNSLQDGMQHLPVEGGKNK